MCLVATLLVSTDTEFLLSQKVLLGSAAIDARVQELQSSQTQDLLFDLFICKNGKIIFNVFFF